ncbi:MAG: DUF3501 family protein [Pseudomonadota bacterium]
MKLSRQDLWSLEEYAEARPEFRARVIAHKKNRQVHLTDHATLYFEDRLTMQYQIQEMLRIEKIFVGAQIKEELEAYNPLIPDGRNWKATFMIEYPDVEERTRELAVMGGIEHTVWVQVGDGAKSFAIANEDMERSDERKAAAVHFMRFELSAEQIADVKAGANVRIGIDHERQISAITLPQDTRSSLAADLE